MHELRERMGLVARAMETIGEEMRHIFDAQRPEQNLLHTSSVPADRFERLRQRMRGTDLVVPVGADQQEVPDLRLGGQVLQQIKRRRVEPLQVVQKQHEGMFGPGKDADEAPQNSMKTVLRLQRWKVGNGRRLADDQFQFRDQIQHQSCVGTERLIQGRSPSNHLRIALRQNLLDEALEGLSQRGVRDVPFVLVEFAQREESARPENLRQRIDHRGFSHAGVAGNQDEFCTALVGHPAKRGEQRGDFLFPSIELFRDLQLVRHVLGAEGKQLNARIGFPSRQTTPQIGAQPNRRLEPILRSLGQQLHHDRRERLGNVLSPGLRRHGRPRDMAMHPLHRIAGREGRRSHEQLVERDAECVEIAARIDRASHPPGLLGCHVSQRAGEFPGSLRRRRTPRQSRSDAEARQPRRPALLIDDEVRRFHISMHEPPAVQTSQRGRDAHGQSEKLRHGQRPPEQFAQKTTAGIFGQKRRASAEFRQFDGPRRPSKVQFLAQTESMLELRQSCLPPIRGRGNQQPRSRSGLVPHPQNHPLTVLDERLENAMGQFFHRANPVPRFDRQSELKSRARSIVGLRHEVPTMGLDDGAADRQAHAQPFRLRGKESIEEAFDGRGVQPNASVLHRHE